MRKESIKAKDKKLNTNQILSSTKKKIFFGIMLLMPVILFLIVELILQLFNYGGNLDLFIEGPPGYEEYIRCNPNVTRRYFYAQTDIPTPPKQLFLKKKPSNGFRIFVLGESSAAGFPYGNNISFPNFLERALSNDYPNKRIEVINVAFAAINSYALLDLIDEILEQSPDALIIYTGHNEYYGALGVGSVQSLGNVRWLINTYLKLQSFRSFLLLRDVIGHLSIKLKNLIYKGSEVDPSATLMERIVAEQTIPYGSVLYEAGKKQFKGNMNDILKKAKDKNVPVLLGELVSNVHDLAPFISIEDENGWSAQKAFQMAQEYEKNKQYLKAKEKYVEAKDLDALRFRAPEDFNSILKELAKKYSFYIVNTIDYFEKESPNGLIGNSLLLEHVHPNVDGYFLLAKAFYESVKRNYLIDSVSAGESIDLERRKGFTEFDSVYGALVIKQLKCSWPFQPKNLPNRFLIDFTPSNIYEKIALRCLKDRNYSIEVGHLDLGTYFEDKGELDKAFLEYNALITSIPHEMEFYERAVTVLLKKKDYKKAYQLLMKSLTYKENLFAYKWLGLIELMQEDYNTAIMYLRKADPLDSQVVFNLSRAYYLSNRWEFAEEYFRRLKKLSPKSEYLTYLEELRIKTLQNKSK